MQALRLPRPCGCPAAAAARPRRASVSAKAAPKALSPDSDIYISPEGLPMLDTIVGRTGGGGAAVSPYTGRGGDRNRPQTPPPDLPSLLLHARICFLGMPLVPAVTELIIAELMWLQYMDRKKPVNLYINSSGTTRADGETVGYETEGTAIYDCMRFLRNDIYTVNIGIAYGQSAMLLAAGTPGCRFALEHASTMLLQPRMPPTGARQAIEVQIKWREQHAMYQQHLQLLSKHTGNSEEKLDYDMQRPLYMTPRDAIEYGMIDKVVDRSRKKGGADLSDRVATGGKWNR